MYIIMHTSMQRIRRIVTTPWPVVGHHSKHQLFLSLTIFFCL